MDLTWTLIVLGLAVAVFVIALVLDRRPYVPGRIWRLPTIPIMWLAVLVAVLMVAHLWTLITGTPLKSRYGF